MQSSFKAFAVAPTKLLAPLQLVDVPDSLHEVLASCLIFYTVRLLVNRLAGMLPAPPTPGRTDSGAVAPAARRSASGEAAGHAVGSPASAVRSDDQEAEGIKYEGYAEAIAAAQVRLFDTCGRHCAFTRKHNMRGLVTSPWCC
jgi:hypothetical protein